MPFCEPSGIAFQIAEPIVAQHFRRVIGGIETHAYQLCPLVKRWGLYQRLMDSSELATNQRTERRERTPRIDECN